MSFVTVFASAVPTESKSNYLEHVEQAAEVFRQHGAVRVLECWGTQVPQGKVTSFPLAVKCEVDETVSIGIVEWPSKAVHDKGMPKVISEIGKSMNTGTMSQPPYDGSRMIFGGFEVILEI